MLLVQPYAPSFAGILKRLASSPELQACECSAALEAASVTRKAGAALIIAHIVTEADIVSLASLLKLLAQEISQRKVRTLITSKVRNTSVVQTLNRYGATEIVPEPINERALWLKADRHVRALRKTLEALKSPAPSKAQKQSMEREDDEDTQIRKEKASQRAQPGTQIKLVEPLTLESDFWSSSDEKPKKVAGKWNIRFMGPPPTFGKWARVGEEDGQTRWEWTSSDPENDPFSQLEGKWIFSGQRPEFQGDRWLFVAKHPDLSFVEGGKVLGSKMSCDGDANVYVARDSRQGISAQAMIRNALQASIKKKTASANKEREEREEAEELGDLALRNGGSGAGGGGKVKRVDPLALESDFWLTDGRDPIRVAGRWSVKLIGPGPAAGRWVELETDKGSEQFWQWTPPDPDNDPFIKEQGAWVFRGSAPRFDNDRWVFVGRRPMLAFYYEGESYGAKMAVDEQDNLLLANDSANAQSAYQQIQATLVKVIRKNAKSGEGEEDDGVTVLKEKEGAEGEERAGDGGEEFQHVAGEKGSRSDDEENALESAGRMGERSASEDDPGAEDDAPLGRVIKDEEGDPESSGRVVVDETADEVREGGDLIVDNGDPERVGKVKRRSRDEDDLVLENRGKVIRDDDGAGTDGADGGEARSDGESDEVPELASGRKGKRRQAEEEKEARELSISLGKDKESKLLELNLGREKEARELSLNLGREKEGKELSLDLGKEEEGRELSLDLGKEEEARELSATLGKEGEGTELDYRGADDESARGITDRTGSSGPEESGRPGPQAEAPSADVVPDRPGDSVISPIALAFLLSELMCKRGLELGALTRRYCTYLSAAVHGRRVEFWAERAGGDYLWVASHDGKPGKLAPDEAVRTPGVSVASVRGGKFVFGALKKTDVPVSEKFLEAVSRISAGLGMAWREKFQPAPGSLESDRAA